MSELELLKRIRSGEASGMRLLYDRYIGYLTAVCSRYVVDSAAVKDILQDAFVKVFSKLDGFEYRGEGSLKAWMSRIVVNDSLKSLRSAGRLKYVDELRTSGAIDREFQRWPLAGKSFDKELEKMHKWLQNRLIHISYLIAAIPLPDK